jgi:hypothetical protein
VDDRAAGESNDSRGGNEQSATASGPSPAQSAPLFELLDMIWPETGLQTASRVPPRPKDGLTEDDEIQLQLDFVTLSLTPLEFIQLAAFLRMSIDGLLELHPGLQRAVINAFDLR